jgi:transcriptional regulator GlxA family with amidase domain
VAVGDAPRPRLARDHVQVPPRAGWAGGEQHAAERLFGSSHRNTRAHRSTKQRYDYRLLAEDPDRARQLPVAATDEAEGIGSLADADTIIVTAGPDVPPDPSDEARPALQGARARGGRLVAIGSGTFVLAAAGILAGLRATTHWSVLEELRWRHPDVLTDHGALFTEDGGVFTSAGAAATPVGSLG